MIQNGKRKSFEIIFRTMQKKSSWKLQEMITYHLLVFFQKILQSLFAGKPGLHQGRKMGQKSN